MKKVLITGQNSYIGNAFAEYAKEFYQDIACDKISLRGKKTDELDLSGYDAILHVAGIAHVDVGKADAETKKKYYEINCDLSCHLAEKAKKDGVSQFVYLSSMIIFGDSAPFGQIKIITEDTQALPSGFYGDSKLQAEIGIEKLADENYLVTIVRPPMVFGKGSKGNYPRLARLAVKSPIFPQVDNCRSMIYIENLCELLCQLILKEKAGIYMPQNAEQLSTSELVAMIAKAHGKKIHLTKVFNPGLRLLAKITGYVNKVFGSLTYDEKLSRVEEIEYQKYSIEDAILRTEAPEKRSEKIEE